MSWVFLLIAGFLEVLWASALKGAANNPEPRIIIFIVVTLFGSMFLLYLALKSLPLGVAYPIWTGIGSLGAFIIGVTFFGELMSLGRVIGVILVLSGIVTLKISI